MDLIQLLGRLQERHSMFRFDFKKIVQKLNNCKFQKTIQSAWSLMLCRKIIGNCYFEGNFSQNSTKTIIRLFALNYNEVIVDSTFSFINYQLHQLSLSTSTLLTWTWDWSHERGNSLCFISLHYMCTIPGIWYYSSFGQSSSPWCVNVQ